MAVALLLIILALAAALYIASRRLSRAQTAVDELAEQRYIAWREREIDDVKTQLSSMADREALVKLEKWRVESESGIRHDAVARSTAVVMGKVTEHLAPYMPGFPYNPRDCRFIGSPIDVIIFDGADEGEVREVIFLEVKTNTSALSSRQRQVRDAIVEGRVAWQELRV